MEVPLNRSWGILLLDRVCLAMIVVAVTVGERRYDVSIGSGLIERVGLLLPELPRSRRAFVVSDRVAEFVDQFVTAYRSVNPIR